MKSSTLPKTKIKYYIAGLKVKLNTTSGRADSVLVKDGDNYVPLNPEKDYRVITLDFYLRGGSGFTVS